MPLGQRAHSIYHFFRHWITAKGPDSIHSPFVFRFYSEVLKGKSKPIEEAEKLRKAYLNSDEPILIDDFKSGTGSYKRLRSTAASSLSKLSFSSFLFRLCNFLEAESILETGTNLGINTYYLAKADLVKKLVTIEGNQALKEKAHKSFLQNGMHYVNSVHGLIQEKLVPAIQEYEPDFIFLDAEHTYLATSFCLEEIRKMETPPKCIVLHDIYWSSEMTSLWRELIVDKNYTLTIDLYWAGLLFPSRPMPKQHFNLRM